MNRLLMMFLFGMLMLTNTLDVKAEDTVNEPEYIIEEVTPESIGFQVEQDLPCPYTRYILNVLTHIIDKDDGKLYMGAEVYCSDVMEQIVTNFYLQQWIDGKWVEVCSHTSSRNDSDFMIAFVSVSYPPSGTYRTRTITMVVDYDGFAEGTEGNSGDIDFVSPYT